jgi:hypothetical protein
MTKTLFAIIFLFAILSACKPVHKLAYNEEPRYYKIHEDSWHFSFKNLVFFDCLKKLSPNEFRIIIDSLDGSTSAILERLYFNKDVIAIADSLATRFTKTDSFWPIEGRKVILNACLDYRTSKALDQFADSLYKVIYKVDIQIRRDE